MSQFDTLSFKLTELSYKVNFLESKVYALEWNTPPVYNTNSISVFDVVYEFTERDGFKSKVIAHGILEYFSTVLLTKIKWR